MTFRSKSAKNKILKRRLEEKASAGETRWPGDSGEPAEVTLTISPACYGFGAPCGDKAIGERFMHLDRVVEPVCFQRFAEAARPCGSSQKKIPTELRKKATYKLIRCTQSTRGWIFFFLLAENKIHIKFRAFAYCSSIHCINVNTVP